MGKLNKWAVGAVMLLSCHAFGSQSVQSVMWDKTPIRISLIVGVEQMIQFPTSAEVGLPANLASPDVFNTLFAAKTAYWKATQPFVSERIQVRLAGGEIVLFDVSARVDKTPPVAVDILNIVRADGNRAASHNEGGDSRELATIFDAIRYGVQSTYSPARLVEPLVGVRKTPVSLSGNLHKIYNHKDHWGLVVAVDQAWTVDGLHVTSLSVVSRHSHPVMLDNRLVQHTLGADLHGVERHFVASHFFNHELKAAGDDGDRTTLFIVTDKPLHAVLRF